MINHVFNSLLASAFALIVFIYAQTFAGEIEGRIAPVVVGFEVTQSEHVGDTRSRIYGSFQKARECDFVDLRFYLGTLQASAQVDLVIEEASKQRSAGFEDFGPWLVQLDAEQLAGRAYAIVYHKCHPLWVTETKIFP